LRDYGVEGQIGLEPDFRDYIRKLVRIFVELKDDGSFYLNLGDTYSGSLRGYGAKPSKTGFPKPQGIDPRYPNAPALTAKVKEVPPKCMMGIPWRVALALVRRRLDFTKRYNLAQAECITFISKGQVEQHLRTCLPFCKEQEVLLQFRCNQSSTQICHNSTSE
jgi:hypothetical protein